MRCEDGQSQEICLFLDQMIYEGYILGEIN